MYRIDEKWTPAQRDAILSRGETLLVSAAAGSGKTAVLTERILSRVLDDDDALDLASVLVVTFTKAAAAELRARIRTALEGALAKQPGNRRLHTQLLSVGRAKICTIDSFCLDLIRSHFDDLGLSPRLSVADEAAAKLLAKNVMDTLIEDCFEGEDGAPVIENFGAFCDLFASSRNASALAEVFLSVRETLNGYTEGVDWLLGQRERLVRAAEDDFLASDAGRNLLSELRAFTAAWSARYETVCDYLSTDPVYIKNYGDCFFYERSWLSSLGTLLEQTPSYDAVRAHFQSFAAPGLKSGIRGDKKTEEIVRAKAQHDTFGERRNGYLTRFFTVSSEELSTLLLGQAEVIDKLHTFLTMYEDRLAREKNRRGQLDFGDMGRLALQLLWDRETDMPSDTARAEAMKYTEIYIDEYQDVSPVQDRIFRAIARGDNRFMVGDAKQSIYGFRGASPALFLGYRAAFADDASLGRTIFLSDNFRCDEQVIDFSNLVFSVLFGCGASTLPYTEDDALRYAKKTEGDTPQAQVTLAVLSSDKEEAEDGEDDGADEDAADAYTEADYIADQISALLRDGYRRDGCRIRPRDIAVLMRSTKSSAAQVERALETRGIPSFNNVSRAFFENAEVLLMYCLLAVIDNPLKDVCLAGVLRSPLYRVTLDELIYLRRTYPDGSLYDALCAFTAETGFAKGAYFLERLAYYRHISEGMPVDRFLWMLYGDTGILSLVYEKEKHELFSEALDSAQMRANLMMFYEYARSFERGGYQGLYQFVAFISSVIEEKAQMPPVLLSGEDADAVRIMTVHQSKGLEFPVCFVCGCGKRFNAADQRAPVLMDADGGIATYLGEESGFAKINHPMRECVKDEIAHKQKEEEMRVLYVALTRAREQLYICGTHKSPRDYADSFLFQTVSDVMADDILSQNTTLAWMLTAYAAHKHCANLPVSLVFPTSGETAANTDAPVSENAPADDAVTYRAAKQKIIETFSFVYPDAHLTNLPAKLSVSELLRQQSREISADAAADAEGTAIREKEYAKPHFLQQEEDGRATAAERGTATHQFMQFCDFAALSDTARTPGARIDAEMARLRDGHFLTEETVSRIDRAALIRFLGSRLFRRLAYAKSVRREMRFNLFVAASELPSYQGADVKVLVQGIIDCCYIDAEDRLVLIDYKTDHFPRAVCENRGEVERILTDRYGGQLSYYRAAAEQLYCRPVSDVRIYSFAIGDDFSVF